MFSFVTILTLPSFIQYIFNLTAIGFAGFPDLQSGPQPLQICNRTCRHSRSAVGLASTPDLQSDLQAFQICSRTCKHSKSAVGFAGIPDLQSDLQAFQICNRICRHSRSAVGPAGRCRCMDSLGSCFGAPCRAGIRWQVSGKPSRWSSAFPTAYIH